MNAILTAIMLLNSPETINESKFEKDRQAILAMAGTYSVSFNFEETVPLEVGYELRPAYKAAAREIVVVLEQTSHFISLQHLLKTSNGAIKHWRQDWQYEGEWLWEYQTDLTWSKRTLETKDVKGQWIQRVFQVDDSPRYESIGTWEHAKEHSLWQSQRTNRPLPRREYTKRSDYDVLVATNRHLVTPTGWVHEQDNTKFIVSESRSLVREAGLNQYQIIRDDSLKDVLLWWQARESVWAEIRAAWRDLYTSEQHIKLLKEKDGKRLYHHLFQLASDMQTETKGLAYAQAKEIIHSFLIPAPSAAVKTQHDSSS